MTHPQVIAEAALLRSDAAPLDTEAVFRAHAADVSRWVRALSGPTSDTDDLLQEVFVAVHRQLGGFRGRSSLSTWLFGITQNVVRRHRRVQRVRQFLGGSAQDVAGTLPSAGPSAPEALAQAQARARVYRVLEQLREKHRTALILFELEGRPAAEVAQLCGVTPGVVWVWLHRARADFLKRLTQVEESEGAV